MSKEPEQEQQQQQEQEQEQSPLLRILTDDALRLLFAYLIQLVDAFHLGITCRKLNKLYIASCHDRRSLELYREPSTDIRSWHTFEATAADELTKDNHCRVHLPRGPYERTIPASINLFCQLFKSLPNLVSLEVVEESFTRQTIPFVLTALRFSENLSKRLQALTLAICEKVGDNNNLIVVAALEQLPALKHLTLYLITYESTESTPTIEVVLNSPLLNRVLPQLASFRLYFHDGSPVQVLRFISKHFLRFANVQLAAAAAAVDNSSKLQIALKLAEYPGDEVQWKPRRHRPALACATSLVIGPYHNFKAKITREMMPLLTNLKKVHINLFSDMQIQSDKKWYLGVLTALAKLPKLETVAIDTYGEVPRWTRKRMPVLSTVRSLSLKFGSTYHANPVEAFHLAHCFPGLQQISVTLWQGNCEYCDYPLSADDGALSVFQKCAQRLALDLLRLGTGTGWQAQVELKKLVALFLGRKIRFSSLKNLLAGINDYKEVPE